MRTVNDLLTYGETVFVYLSSETVCRNFLSDAEKSGFTFINGKLPTSVKTQDCIYAIHQNKLMNSVGFVGHVRLNVSDNGTGVRIIDYEKYASGIGEHFYSRAK